MKHCEALVPAATARSMGLDWQREKIECIAEGDNRLTLPAPSPGWPPAEVRARYEPVRLGERGDASQSCRLRRWPHCTPVAMGTGRDAFGFFLLKLSEHIGWCVSKTPLQTLGFSFCLLFPFCSLICFLRSKREYRQRIIVKSRWRRKNSFNGFLGP